MTLPRTTASFHHTGAPERLSADPLYEKSAHLYDVMYGANAYSAAAAWFTPDQYRDGHLAANLHAEAGLDVHYVEDGVFNRGLYVGWRPGR